MRAYPENRRRTLPHTNLVDVPFEKLDSLTASRRDWYFAETAF
jgi:hypothetical protein